ncbi:hypothetical protein Bca52824_028792 [Brassica carinata]|uniref:Uncharacterized protein n=1 Tax=Brassica carinata TaxID=52824 RepID=A0A8X7VCZ0_BRACI|nr:hypothetical protein Bca52824_028792 [Brassica carinata]
MSCPLFLRIVDAVENHDNYFKQRRDIIGRLGLSFLQKTTAVFRMLAYGLPADATDEYIKIGESTAIESMKRFCRAVVEIFSEEGSKKEKEREKPDLISYETYVTLETPSPLVRHGIVICLALRPPPLPLCHLRL